MRELAKIHNRDLLRNQRGIISYYSSPPICPSRQFANPSNHYSTIPRTDTRGESSQVSGQFEYVQGFGLRFRSMHSRNIRRPYCGLTIIMEQQPEPEPGARLINTLCGRVPVRGHTPSSTRGIPLVPLYG